MNIRAKNEAHEWSGLLVHYELFAIFSLRLRNTGGFEPQGRRLTVPVSTAGILKHRAFDVLRIFCRMILIEDRYHRKRQLSCGIARKILRYRDQFDAGRTKLCTSLEIVQSIPKHPGKRMGDDHVEMSISAVGEHLLINSPCGSCRTRTRLNVGLYICASTFRNISFALGLLVRD
nr:hypothetical protein [Pontixanthobacter rizhaonensis]